MQSQVMYSEATWEVTTNSVREGASPTGNSSRRAHSISAMVQLLRTKPEREGQRRSKCRREATEKPLQEIRPRC